MVFEVLHLQNHKNHTYLHGFRGFTFAESYEPYIFTWFSGFYISRIIKTIHIYMVFGVSELLLTIVFQLILFVRHKCVREFCGI